MRKLFIFLSIVFISSPLFSQTNIYQYDKTHFKSFDSRFQKLPESIREKLQLLIPAEAVPSGLERFNRDERNHIKFFTNMTVGESGLQETYTFYSWDIVTQNWSIDPYLQDIYTYDLNGNLTEILSQIWDGTIWVNNWQDLYTYDSNENLIEWSSQTWNGTVWVNYLRNLSTYDSNGFLTEILSQIWDGTIWVNNWQDLYTYDTNGFITESLWQNWDGTIFVNSFRFLITYDSNGYLIERILQIWDGTVWVNSWLALYINDSNGMLIERIVQIWDGTVWVNDWLGLYTYDSNGIWTELSWQIWDGTVWVNDGRYLYTYDSNGNQTEWLSLTWDGTVWVNYSQLLFTYDTNGNLIEDLYQTWDGSNWVNDYIVYVEYTNIVGVEDGEVVPKEYSLEQNYPNPFNPTTTIEYTLLSPGEVSLIIYNLRGEEVALLINGNMPAGNHQVSWDASGFASGIYFYRLQADDFVQTKKMLLLK